METLNTIAQLISMTGFPIFACLALGWYIKSVMDKLEVTITEMRIVIEKNTLIIEELTRKLENGGE